VNIVHITFSLRNGGKENMMVDIVNEQVRQGHRLAVIIINNESEPSIINRISPSVQLFLLKRKGGSKKIAFLLKLFFILQFRFKADVAHCHDINLGTLLNKVCKARLVLTVHGPGYDTKPMKQFHKLFAISNSIKEDVEKRSDLKCKVIYNGIWTELIEKKINKPDKNNFKIVHVKRLNHERKGQDLLIKAAHELVYKHNAGNLRFYLLGDGESRLFLEKMIRDLKLSEYVIIEGNQSREWIYKNLCQYDIFVHPSRFEGFGLSVVEAMAVKIPVIASNIEGPAEILNNGKYGMLFENGDVYGLVARIQETVSQYESDQMKDLVNNAYHYCINNFDISITAGNYCKSYFE
jgi:glycosyltransferase involved in cell wall biosynthesis